MQLSRLAAHFRVCFASARTYRNPGPPVGVVLDAYSAFVGSIRAA